MVQLNDVFLALECFNFAVTILFLLLFVYRLVSMRNLAVSQRYLHVYPKARIILAVVYIIISVVLLVFNIVEQQFKNGALYLIAGGGGQCVNSVILVVQLGVLREELKKERPYTCTHLVYSIYLMAISCIRFILTLYYLVTNYQVTFEEIDLALSVLLMVDTTLLLGYWIVKRQELPEFQDIKYFNMDNFKSASSYPAPNLKFSDINTKYDEDFPFIMPSVSVDKGKLSITLQILASSLVLELEETQARPQKSSKKLQILSQKVVTAEDMKEFYTICGRFNISQKLRFVDTNYIELYNKVQAFLDELFASPIHYTYFVLRFFEVPEAMMTKYASLLKGKASIYEHDQTQKVDANATFISITLYKHMWIDDHYQFYMRAITPDELYKSHPMKRFTDFEELDDNLRSVIILRKNGHWKLELPHLPKKHLFNWDEDKISQRKKELEVYIRKIANDSVLMEYPEIRDKVFTFLNLRSIYSLTPRFRESSYEGLDVKKGNINKALIANEYVTFYEFKLFSNGIELITIKKRFSEFIGLHEDLRRWMNNVQITYNSVQLPQKHMYKSETNRHEKLLHYLRSVIQVRDIYKVYEVGVFLNIASDMSLEDDSLYGPISIIRTKSINSFRISSNPPKEAERKSTIMPEIQIPDNPSLSYSSNQRMSRLIEDLGKNQEFDED